MRRSDRNADRRPLVPFGVQPGLQQQGRKHHQHRHKQVHVRGQVQHAMAEGGQNAQRIERGLRVVAQKLGIAEEEAGLGIVPAVPAGQRQHAA
jgi:hypothetical protein